MNLRAGRQTWRCFLYLLPDGHDAAGEAIFAATVLTSSCWLVQNARSKIRLAISGARREWAQPVAGHSLASRRPAELAAGLCASAAGAVGLLLLFLGNATWKSRERSLASRRSLAQPAAGHTLD